MKNILTEIKSTLIGCILIGISIWFFLHDFESWHEATNRELAISIGMFTVGLLLLFSRDTFINAVLSAFRKLVGALIKNNNQTPPTNE
jgi:Kef-type K+ transport system membrane component KefB